MELFLSTLNMLFQVKVALRRLVNFFIHSVTGKCELERICEGASGKHGFKKCQEIEYSLLHSKHEDIRKLLVSDSTTTTTVKEAIQTIRRIKEIDVTNNSHFVLSMCNFLRKIFNYAELSRKIDEVRSIDYDEKNSEHRQLLFRLWTVLKGGDEQFEQQQQQHIKLLKWREIGFQGNNPGTDFRGMGLLGLVNLVYLVEKNKETATKILNLSKHPQHGFMFAVGGIYFTGVTLELLTQGKLKGYFYNLPDEVEENTLEHFQDVFSQIYLEFSEYWVSRKPKFLSFGDIVNDYLKTVHRRLDNGQWIQQSM